MKKKTILIYDRYFTHKNCKTVNISDDVLTLAQRHKSASEDLFTSQESCWQPSQKEIQSTPAVPECLENDVDLGTQTFSILDSTSNVEMLDGSEKLDAIAETQPYNVSASH